MTLALRGITKSFGATRAVDSVDLDIAAGEFIAVLGPSGCGKTTLLRLVAGFETPDSGTLAIDGTIVAASDHIVPPEDRRIGVVFQSYALWPHMNVARNVGYALEVAKLSPAEREQRIDEVLDLVDLRGFEQRRPQELSGGQRQRVALARCLAMRPRVMLLDEPLANLDAHLRTAMIDEFLAIHARTGVTTLYVTHDQSEAMALATRVAVMDHGRIVQVADPVTLYREPASAMVGAFIGRGTVVKGDVVASERGENVVVDMLGARIVARARPGATRPNPATLCLRPESLALMTEAAADRIDGRVVRALYRGGFHEVEIAPDAAPAMRLRADAAAAPAIGAVVHVAVRDAWVLPS
jgi:iron(III) transport system ATP-binding protein